MPRSKQQEGLYQREEGGVWYVNIRHAGHRVRRSTGEHDRQKAQAVYNRIYVELVQSVPVISGHSWGEAVLEWCKVRPRSESDLLSLKKFATKFSDRALSAVTAEDVDAALSFCKTAGTYTRYRTTIAAILNLAVENGWLAKPVKLKQRKERTVKPREWLTREQWIKLYNELPAHQRSPAEFSVETGLRQENTLGLEWRRVDLRRRVVWVEAEDTKGGEPLVVPLSDRAVAILTAIKGGRESPQGFVFLYRGEPISDVKTGFQAACIRAGLGRVVSGKYQGFTWHGLRHTWATWHVQNETPLDVLQKLGGWADLRMVMHYAHHSPGHLAQYANNTRKKA